MTDQSAIQTIIIYAFHQSMVPPAIAGTDETIHRSEPGLQGIEVTERTVGNCY